MRVRAGGCSFWARKRSGLRIQSLGHMACGVKSRVVGGGVEVRARRF